MKIMSIDYGDKRTGIAFCDINEILASPYTVITEGYQPKLVKKLSDIIAKEKPEKIVIGLPRNMDGSYGYRCDECRSLGDELSKICDIPIDYQDERLTTVMAHNALSENNVRGKKRKESVDAVSAVMILQSYIDSNKR
ncbi:MAG: Holliday junction resolvase RuvX [Eubacterium sp.]|nr:Holliday junction resolvase RuvX [Eubacterium sp.]